MDSTGQRGRRNINWVYRPNEHMSDYSSHSAATYTYVSRGSTPSCQETEEAAEEAGEEEEEEAESA